MPREPELAVQCSHSFFKFSEISMAASIIRKKHSKHAFYFFQKIIMKKKENN